MKKGKKEKQEKKGKGGGGERRKGGVERGRKGREREERGGGERKEREEEERGSGEGERERVKERERGLWDHSSRLQWGYNGGKTHAGNPFGISGNTPPDLQALECGRRHFGACGGYSQDGRGGQAFGGRPPGTRCAALQGQIQSPHRWSGQAQACPFAAVGGARDRRVRYGTQRGGRFAAGQTAAGTRRQGPVGEGNEENEARQAATQGRGTHWQAHPHWLQCRGALGFRGFGLHSDTAPIHQSRRGQSRIPAQPRAKRSHNDAGKCPGCGAFRHHRLVILAWATGVWEGTPGRATRLPGQAQSSQLAVVRRNGRTGHLRAHALATGLERAVCETPHDLLSVAPKTVGFWVDQASLLWSDSCAHWNQSKGPLFWEGHSSFLASWKVGHSGIGTCSSSWSREASGPRKGLRGSGARNTAAASCATMDQAPCSTAATNARPCRQKETCTSRRRCARLHAQWVPNTGSSLHTAFFLTLRHSAPRRAAGGAHFHGRLFVGQRCAATGWLGCGSGRRCGEPQGGGLRSGTERRFACTVRPRWRRLCSGHGGAVHIGSAHAQHRLRRHNRNSQWAKAQSLGSPGPPRTFLEQAPVFPRRGQGGQGQGSCDRVRRGGVQKSKRPCRHLCQERG